MTLPVPTLPLSDEQMTTLAWVGITPPGSNATPITVYVWPGKTPGEGVFWEIHHKKTKSVSRGGFRPDAVRLMVELLLQTCGITADSLKWMPDALRTDDEALPPVKNMLNQISKADA